MSTDISELKQTERLFTAVRWAAVPVLLVLGWLHPPLSMTAAGALSAGLCVANVVVWYFNRRIQGARAQQVLAAAVLAVDTAVAWTAIWFFVADRTTAAYAGFGLVVIEAAVRYALPGGLGMAALFAGGLAGAMWARLVLHDIDFSIPGYVFWVLFMGMLALAVGALVRQSRERQQEVRRLGGEQARLAERHRLAREMHDTLLKTLHGLALEAHSLQAVASERQVVERARYIEEVCAKGAVDIRELIFDLRHEELEPFGHRASRVIEQWRARAHVRARFHQEGDVVTLPPRLDYDLRQALEEALLNVERHAAAQEVSVLLRVDGRTLELEVQDDGSKSDVAASDGAGGGIGLLSIKERAEQWGGRMEFTRGPDGAMLRLIIPWPPVPAIEEGVRG